MKWNNRWLPLNEMPEILADVGVPLRRTKNDADDGAPRSSSRPPTVEPIERPPIMLPGSLVSWALRTLTPAKVIDASVDAPEPVPCTEKSRRFVLVSPLTRAMVNDPLPPFRTTGSGFIVIGEACAALPIHSAVAKTATVSARVNCVIGFILC